jgi:hypothetical protein
MVNKVVFFGAGGQAEHIWKQLQSMPLCETQCVAFTDNNSSLWGKTFKGIKIISPYELTQDTADFFVVTSIYENAIKRQLTDEIGISRNRVCSFDEYKRKCYTQWQYDRRYGSVKTPKKNYYDLNRVVVYTAITGGYDDLHDPMFTDDDLTYVCFTDNENIKSDIWNVEYIRDEALDHMHLAKKIKLFPHLYFKDFSTSIWVDGKLEIQGDLRDYIREYERDRPVLCFPHYERACIYEEAGTCLFYKKGDKEELIRQISDYYREGYPINNGLYEMACIVRRHNDDLVQKVMADWHREIERYSYRDQVSFPVACYHNHFLPDICDKDIYHNKWLKVYAHVL